MTTNETLGPSGTRLDRYLEDISVDELSANAPTEETSNDKNAQRERNTKHKERRRRLCESLPIRNLTEALNQVKSRVHTTPEQCIMSITMITHQAQGMRAREFIAKLAEDAYFMRVDNRVTQVPPLRTRSHKS
jgi:division protein CdvB (Snf7/Vps24/ESCRT-III family)